MRTSLPHRGPADRNCVNIDEPWEERYWGDRLACTGEQLRAAVDAVGVMVVDVKAYLQTMRHGAPCVPGANRGGARVMPGLPRPDRPAP